MEHQQRVELYEALVAAFSGDLPGLARMLQFRAKWDPGDVPAPAPGQLPRDVIFVVTDKARMEGTELALLEAALDARPRNPRLRALAEGLNFGILAPLNTQVLQREVTLGLPNVPVEVWREQLGLIEAWVCKIELHHQNPPESVGTGFLIGPDLVATARHVVENVIDGPRQPADVRVRFDYRATSTGTRVRDGIEVRLNTTGGLTYPNTTAIMAASWLVDSAPHDKVDLIVNPGNQLPDPGSLDFAILRLADAIGRQPVNPKETTDRTEAPRGWAKVPPTPVGLTPPGSVLIVQHPGGRPMELALGGNGLIGLNGNHTRVRYRTNTAHAASGSPCFDLNWDLIALHHAGDPNYKLAYTPQWNQGIPFHLIAARLTKNGFGALLNQPL